MLKCKNNALHHCIYDTSRITFLCYECYKSYNFCRLTKEISFLSVFTLNPSGLVLQSDSGNENSMHLQCYHGKIPLILTCTANVHHLKWLSYCLSCCLKLWNRFFDLVLWNGFLLLLWRHGNNPHLLLCSSLCPCQHCPWAPSSLQTVVTHVSIQ